ncbi:MAG: dual specificity protein phosphatase [Frankiales bacterium]|nr:dual specificity protein phosphatase [Frankiales bacterium]
MLVADSLRRKEPTITQTLPLVRHANLHFVTPRLAVGGDLHPKPLTAADQLNDIDNVGITHIVDCRIEWSDEDLFAENLPHIGYLHHGMDDAGQLVPYEWFDKAIDFIDAAGPDAIVLTHCHMGINRGPSLGYAVLLHWGWDAIEAIAAIRAARPQANVWYAGDALRWHHKRQGTDPSTDLRRLEQWRDDNPLDVVRLIRQARE